MGEENDSDAEDEERSKVDRALETVFEIADLLG